ncbi:MAG: IS110 family transposase [Candidatus Cloacimonetes bacterium]|jgi:transposase|nr:IS110 family transposase [Candidatus Cloacimonadota bacterium]MDY0325196.1 IS110 family transposase [Candidatus Cloacimonadaceae bacterium]
MTFTKHKVINNLQVVNLNCAGIDIHRDTANVTLLSQDNNGDSVSEYLCFNTDRKSLLKMKEWLLENNCLVVGIESTGKYWIPVHNVLEDSITVKLYNARNVKNIPVKKTDKSDSQWLATITRYNLARASFIPEKQIRDARTLSRNRTATVQARTMMRQVVHGVLQSAGIKLSSNMSDIFGKSGTNLLDLITYNKPYTEATIKKLVYGPLKDKSKLLVDAMEGDIRPAHRYTLKHDMAIMNTLTTQKEDFERELEVLLLNSESHRQTFERLQEIPGFAKLSALLLLAEIGFDLDTFPTCRAFCSWAGVCPGNHESAGKKLHGKIQQKKNNVKTLLIEIAWVSVRMKETYYAAKFMSMRARKGPNVAIFIIAHKLAKAIFQVVKREQQYDELGFDHVVQDNISRSKRYVVNAIQKLGKEAVLEMIAQQEIAPII